MARGNFDSKEIGVDATRAEFMDQMAEDFQLLLSWAMDGRRYVVAPAGRRTILRRHSTQARVLRRAGRYHPSLDPDASEKSGPIAELRSPHLITHYQAASVSD